MTLTEFNFSAPEHSIRLDQYVIRYWDTQTQNKPLLLLCGGVGSSVEIWANQFCSLSQDYRIIAWDYPGHGLSSPVNGHEDLNVLAILGCQLLKQIADGPVHLAGNSLGAAVATRIYEMMPEKVLSLGLLNSATLGHATPFPFRLMGLPGIGALLSQPGRVAFTNQCKAIFYQAEKVDKLILEAVRRNSYHKPAQQGLRHFVSVINSVFGQRNHLIRTTQSILNSPPPVTWFVHGREDMVIPELHSRLQSSNTPSATLHVFSACGHTPQAEKPGAINQLIRTMLDRGEQKKVAEP